MTKEFNLFANIDLTEDDFLDASEVNGADLFGDSLTDTEEPKKEEAKKDEAPVVPVKKEAKGKSKAKDTKKKTKSPMEHIVDGTWEVAYAGHRVNPPHEMKVEELRAWLELDYPELSKERCRMIVEEDKKLIVPVVSGAKNG